MNPIYVSDAVKAVVATLALDDSVVVNVAGDEVVGIREIAVLSGEALGAEPVFEDGGFLWLVLIGAGVALLVSELRKARRRRS